MGETVDRREIADVLDMLLTDVSGVPRADELALLTRILSSALETDDALAETWNRALSAPSPVTITQAAAELERVAAVDGRLSKALVSLANPSAKPTAGHSNRLEGNAQISGHQVQARDISGGVHFHQAPVSSSLPLPRQIPAVSQHLVGREADMAALEASRQGQRSSPGLIVVSGPAGVGKSTLVCRWVSELEDQYPDGLFYADLGGYSLSGASRSEDVLDRFLRALGATDIPVRISDKSALWRSFTARSKVAVVLDNAITAAQVRPLLPGATDRSLTVVTSRNQLTGLVVEGASLYRLGALAPDAAVRLLGLGGGGDRIGRERDAAQDVVALCAYLPLAVCLAAARLAARPRQPLATMAVSLSRGMGPLEELRLEGQAAIKVALDESHALLTTDVARAYACLGMLPTNMFSTDLVAAACALPLWEADRVLESLVETSMLEELGPDAYRFHDLVHAHARRCGEEAGAAERDAVLRRFVDWLLQGAAKAELLLTPSHQTLPREYTGEPGPFTAFEDAAGALSWLDSHQAMLDEAIRYCADSGLHAACWQLTDAAWPLFLRLRPAELWIRAHRLGLEAARAAGDRAAQRRMLTSGGNGLRNAGEPEEAAEWYQQALRMAREDGDRRDEAQATHGLGVALFEAGRLPDAEHRLLRALGMREDIGYRRGAALSRIVLGQVCEALGRVGEAVAYLTDARGVLVEIGDAYDAARALALLGHVLASAEAAEGTGPGEGVRHLRAALAEFAGTGSVLWQGRCMEMLGQAAEWSGAGEEAADWYLKALAVLERRSPRDSSRIEGRLHGVRP
ncbi:tetratricopeptide repeat protein [Streptomyces sp. NPDC049881]|uniref:tetratricopeptide repeat protein n=1 Tax=Streptomyces sp. NPDC049881 TaxID=3155778 RepID=UPI00343E29C1